MATQPEQPTPGKNDRTRWFVRAVYVVTAAVLIGSNLALAPVEANVGIADCADGSRAGDGGRFWRSGRTRSRRGGGRKSLSGNRRLYMRSSGRCGLTIDVFAPANQLTAFPYAAAVVPAGAD